LVFIISTPGGVVANFSEASCPTSIEANTLLSGLLKMYKDQEVDGYYDPSLLSDYKVRYNLFMLVVLFIGLIAIVIPFVIR